MTEHIDVICVYDNDEFSAPIEYTLDLILAALDVRYKIVSTRQLTQEDHCGRDSLLISYASDLLHLGAERQIHIHASDFFGKDYLKIGSLPSQPLRRFDGLPVVYHGVGCSEVWVRESENLIETNVDIVASSFFMVSRYEEVVLDSKDAHDRFPASSSLAYEERFLNRPLVNEYVKLLWGWIHSLKPNLRLRRLWPRKKEFAVYLAHDVDCLRKYSLLPPAFGIGSALVRKKKPRLAFSIGHDYLATRLHLRNDPFDTFDYLLNVEQSHGFSSSFYFMSGGDSEYDGRYSITHPNVKMLIRAIQSRGCEVGLHGSYRSYDDSERLLHEKNALDKVAANKTYGCRQHYLRSRIPETWRAQERAGFLYDATMGFADHAGFRCGICVPFRPFDILENRRLSIWELPLIVQEGTLEGANYQNLSPEAAYEATANLIEAAKACQGVFTLLWHNSSFDSLGRWAGWRETYERIMRYISQQNGWVTTGREIILWWRQRTSMAAEEDLGTTQ